jgi:hypothetical protein
MMRCLIATVELYASDIHRVRRPARRSPNVSCIRRNDLRKTAQDERAERTPWHTITQTICSMSVARSRRSCHPGLLLPWGRRKGGGQVSTCRLATDDQWRNMSFSRLGDTYDERMPRLPEVWSHLNQPHEPLRMQSRAPNEHNTGNRTRPPSSAACSQLRSLNLSRRSNSESLHNQPEPEMPHATLWIDHLRRCVAKGRGRGRSLEQAHSEVLATIDRTQWRRKL